MATKTYIYEDSTKQVQTIAERDINGVLGDIIGPEFREYRRRWKRATDFEECGKYPIHIDLELNNVCNLRCRMCVYSVRQAPKLETLDIDTVKKMITEGIPLGLRSLGLSFNNEPLLTKNVIEFCSWASSQGIIDIIFATNATLLSREISEKVIDSGITRFRFSLDAYSKKMYEKIRAGANYERTMENIHYFLTLKKRLNKRLPITSVNFVLMKENERELADFKKYWEKHVDYIVVQNLVPVDHTDMAVARTHAVAKDFRCPQPWQRLIIRSDGSVLPCCYHNKFFMNLGNIYKKSIYQMWNSKFMDELRTAHKEGRYRDYKACRRCAASMSTGT